MGFSESKEEIQFRNKITNNDNFNMLPGTSWDDYEEIGRKEAGRRTYREGNKQITEI